jgi:hypothetical protein
MELNKKNIITWIGIIGIIVLIYLLFFKKELVKRKIGSAIFANPPKKDVGGDKDNTPKTNESAPKKEETEKKQENAKTSEKPKDEDMLSSGKWFSGDDGSGDKLPTELGYVGIQDCVEPCEKRFQLETKKCFDKYNGLKGTNECLALVEKRKKECLSDCKRTYPTNENYNSDVRDNYSVIMSRTLFGQGYV